MDDKQNRGENGDATRSRHEVPPSLMSVQGREAPLEVQCSDSGFGENLSLSNV